MLGSLWCRASGNLNYMDRGMEDVTTDYPFEYKANLHLHSLLSDGAYGLDELVRIIQASSFDIVSLTDHNEIRNSLILQQKIKDRIVILGTEITTSDFMEVLVYFKNRDDVWGFSETFVKNRGRSLRGTYLKTGLTGFLDAIKDYDTLLGVPHPFGAKGLVRRLYKRNLSTQRILTILEEFDFYETANPTKSEKNNNLSYEWFRTNTPDLYPTGSSDLHSIRSSFSLAGTVIRSKDTLNLDSFFSLIKSRSKDILFLPYGRSLSRMQRGLHHLCSVINYFRRG